MTLDGWLQIAIYFVVLTALVLPLGRFMARVFEGERTFLSPVLQPVETGLYRVAGVDETREQHWIAYTIAMLLFNAAGFLIAYALQRLQAGLPRTCRRSRPTLPSTPPSASPATPTGRTTAARAR
jgi:K+-transporting ATPase ATPase A chain